LYYARSCVKSETRMCVVLCGFAGFLLCCRASHHTHPEIRHRLLVRLQLGKIWSIVRTLDENVVENGECALISNANFASHCRYTVLCFLSRYHDFPSARTHEKFFLRCLGLIAIVNFWEEMTGRDKTNQRPVSTDVQNSRQKSKEKPLQYCTVQQCNYSNCK
jgi:hypothetical protein